MKVFATIIHVCYSIIKTIGQILRTFPFKSLTLFKNSLTSPFPALKALWFCNKLTFFQFKKFIPNVHLYRIVKISGNRNLMLSLAFSAKIKVLVSYLIILKSRHFEELLKKKFILLLLPVLISTLPLKRSLHFYHNYLNLVS